MAKPLGPKSVLIRAAIKAHPKMGNQDLADKLNDAEERMDDKIKVTANDIAQQRQAMKKAAAKAGSKPASAGAPPRRKPGRRPGAAASATRTKAPASSAGDSSVELIDKVFELAEQSGGFAALKRVVDRLAGMES